VFDLRTLAPLDEMDILTSGRKTGRVAVFDVGGQKFGLAAEVARMICMGAVRSLISPLVSMGQK
jgi:pyruvate/2-oxoglutarate/acetoin dehydrogenase E1 component